MQKTGTRIILLRSTGFAHFWSGALGVPQKLLWPYKKTRLEKLNSDHGRMVDDCHFEERVYEVDTCHTFTQAIGYLKYLAGERGNIVAFRGQRRLYKPFLVPSLFRKVTTENTIKNREEKLGELLNRIKQQEQVLRAVNENAREPLLQHYGINTRWIDLVDNVWGALWFACYRAYSPNKTPQFLHFEMRDARAKGENKYAYILIVEIECGTEFSGCRGMFSGDKTTWIDLRIAVPSHFLRPHAQHGILFRSNDYKEGTVDCGCFVVGVVRVRLSDAFEWIGDGKTLGVHSFFPPPVYDYGYQELLKGMPDGHEDLGKVQHIGA